MQKVILYSEVECMLEIQTDTFIIPHFQKMGAFCTGRTVKNFDVEDSWFLDKVNDSEEAESDYLQNVVMTIPEIEDYPLTDTLHTPFIPLPNFNLCSDGYGTIFPNSEPDSVIQKSRNVAIQKFYKNRISKLKSGGHKKKNKLGISVYKSLSNRLRTAPLKREHAYTNLGILLRGPLSGESEDTIIYRARIFAEENNFKILTFNIKKFDEIFISGIK